MLDTVVTRNKRMHVLPMTWGEAWAHPHDHYSSTQSTQNMQSPENITDTVGVASHMQHADALIAGQRYSSSDAAISTLAWGWARSRVAGGPVPPWGPSSGAYRQADRPHRR